MVKLCIKILSVRCVNRLLRHFVSIRKVPLGAYDLKRAYFEIRRENERKDLFYFYTPIATKCNRMIVTPLKVVICTRIKLNRKEWSARRYWGTLHRSTNAVHSDSTFDMGESTKCIRSCRNNENSD